MSSYSIIGKPLPMTDSPSKVTGLGRYSDDISVPGMLVGKMSPGDIIVGGTTGTMGSGMTGAGMMMPPGFMPGQKGNNVDRAQLLGDRKSVV